MIKWFLGIICVLSVAACSFESGSQDPPAIDDDTLIDAQAEAQPETFSNPYSYPPMLGRHFAKHVGQGGGSRSVNLSWHRGEVVSSTLFVRPIFWGTSWNDGTFVNDKLLGLQSFYSGLDNSYYAGTNTEYKGSTGFVSTSVQYTGFLTDLSPAPNTAPSTSAVLNEVCQMVGTPVPSGYYPVYVDTPRGSAGYCAWHSYGSCNGVRVTFGLFFSLDDDPGCDPQDELSGHSQGLSALANVSGHEYSEVLTDPYFDGWYDVRGEENADKCAWTFARPLTTFSNGSQWKMQGNWSNSAYKNGTGYPNRSGQKGCL